MYEVLRRDMTDAIDDDDVSIEERQARGIQLFRDGFRQTSRRYRGVSRRVQDPSSTNKYATYEHLELDNVTFEALRQEAKHASENNAECSNFGIEVACCSSKDKLKGRTCRKLRFRNDEDEP